MGLKAAVQALKKAEPLKDKVQRCKDLLNDNDAWVCQQQLQKIYQQVLILDLEYALDKKVEQELWSLGFKNYIVTLQSQAKDRKNPKRGESQALLSWCLEAASGFYLTLLQEICTVFDLDLPFRRKGYVYGCTSPWKAVEKLSPPHKSSCFYACQYCLVHLGDIARYRNESKQAEMFYRHAVSLSPSSGQPYNQLALLEASRGNKLGTVFHYARSVAVKHPFPVATANLATTLSSALNDKSFNIDGKIKLNSQEYVTVFLKLHGIVHILGDLKLACSYSKQLTETLTALVATESFSSWMLVQMLVINLYALQHTAGIGTDNVELLKNEQMVNDKKLARDCILDLIAGTLSALLLPVYTMKNSIIEYFALPSIKLCLDWINIKPTVLEEVAFTSRLQIWPSLCVLLNALQNCVVDFKYDEYVAVPLPEDRDLQGFLPLEKSFENLRFTNTALEGDIATLNKLRAVRILHLGHCFAQYQINGSTPISIMTEEKTGDNKFTSMSNGTGPSNELMKELEELSLNKDKQLDTSMSPVLSEAASSKSSVETDLEILADKKIFQGILKPQGSLERNRDSSVNTAETSNSEVNSLPCARKPRQNIAMQAIMRRAENEQKQVTFKNVSPVIVEEENDKKSKVVTVPSITSVANKPLPIPEIPKVNEPVNTNNILVNVQNRLSAMPLAPSTSPNQSLSIQNQQRSTKLPPSIPMPTQVNKLTVKEQQTQQVAQQILPQMHTSMTSQCGQQPSILGSVCYSNQSFNVQNPQFAKNFMANRSPLANASRYQMQGQLNNNGQSVPTMPQSINGIHHTISQSRPLHQRVSQTVSHSPAQLLQQNIQLGSSAQQNMISQSMNLQTNNMGLQSSISIEQPNHSMGLQKQQTMMPSNSRPNDMHSQLNMNGSNMANMSAIMSALSVYEKDPQQQTLTTLANSQSPTNTSNFQLNFSHFNQNQSFGQPLSQSQPSPSFYKKNSDAIDFPFPNQVNVTKNQPQQQQSVANSYMFSNYEPSEHFNLWKDSRPSQPPIAWWDSASNATTQMHMKDSIANDNTFSNWSDSSSLGNTASRIPLTPGKNYQPQQQNGQHGRHLMAGGNNFEDSRLFELEQKPSQAVNTGNTYSLFSGNTWSTVNTSINSGSTNQDPMKTRLHQQSLWSGPGPSPLERLLEQQKSLREGGTT
ncbi:Protein SMG7 [Trachymyrmex zeteki]|uniref:Protein SMG7 n=1 Tax=Mycetomoellerius zeteki TaxID=64791 RepID=A0A151XBI0_9HYME|nr:PREDICTED: protein SMG7-like [Trachymyrmex zeteki]XP_018300529.1 PREDICTED: protein SMG7-like [Trachymyrmex zeteki]XP_018300530.1 PREDICTED: protein SMG7-like [Trachymyrmex zeteki]XP_018300531.1 PREDICTED: protein SMG7-like [Trachymyrmex zeteki]XP_018300532.1 PREDICTED: protein SMG7-like [Trachymyrmex zeteki]KYQ57660.1 Protein SMG7 [Trachymyrmex zeteki]